jgi:hypothetical protein
MLFRFEKLYADLVSADGTVCVAYVTRLDMFDWHREWAGLEQYDPDGSRTVRHARGVVVSRSDRELRITLDLPSGLFLLQQEIRSGSWQPSGPPPSPHISWTVEVGRAHTRATWYEGGAARSLTGCGYADRVVLDRPPRALGLSTLSWGRAHLPRTTVVWNALTPREGPQWRRSMCWRDGEEGCESPDFSPLPLRRERSLHEGPALDPSRFPSRGERWLTRLLAGDVVEHRELSRVDGGGWALHERVTFGPHGAAIAPEHLAAPLGAAAPVRPLM